MMFPLPWLRYAVSPDRVIVEFPGALSADDETIVDRAHAKDKLAFRW